MHAPEKSDCAVIPMNQPNKEEQSSAEVGKGRARTKENIVQSNTSPTQSGERVSQGLRGVRQAAKERRQERFTALLHHVSVGLLRDSFYALKRQAAPGVDGMTWKEYETGLEDRIADLHSRVHRDHFGSDFHHDSRGAPPFRENLNFRYPQVPADAVHSVWR